MVDQVVHRFRDGGLVDQPRPLLFDPLVEPVKDQLSSSTALVRVGDTRRGIGRGTVRVVEQADEADADEGAVAVDGECVEPASTRATNTRLP